MDQQRITADIADSLVDTNELSEPLFDFRRDDTGGVLVDVYEPELDGEGDLPVSRTYRLNVVSTEPDGSVEADKPAQVTAPAAAGADDLFTAYSAALDEIYALRTGAAYEAALLEQVLALKTFPAGSRQATRQQQERLRLSARGEAGEAYQGISDFDLRVVRTQAGMPQLLTRHQFEESLRGR